MRLGCIQAMAFVFLFLKEGTKWNNFNDEHILNFLRRFEYTRRETRSMEIINIEDVENNPLEENALTQEILNFLGDNPKVSKAIEPN